MRARLVTPTVIGVIALLFSSASAFVLPRPLDPQQTMAPTKPAEKKKSGKAKTKSAKSMKGVPKGIKACLEHLTQMASTDPMTPYAGHPQEIVNNGLLWNDPKSKCSIGSDPALRLKVTEMAKAWQEHNAEKVKALLDEIKSAAPQT